GVVVAGAHCTRLAPPQFPATDVAGESSPMSAPNPGDILPLWQPDIPGEEIQTGRLGIRVRPGSPAEAKLAIIPDGPEWLRQALEGRGEIDGTYTCTRPDKPLDLTAQDHSTLATARLGR